MTKELLAKGSAMRRSFPVLFALGLLLAMGSNAFAHFLFIKVGAEQDAQRSIEVLFGLSTREGAPQFLEKIANTQLWLLSSDGKKVPIKLKKGFDRLVGTVPSRKASRFCSSTIRRPSRETPRR